MNKIPKEKLRYIYNDIINGCSRGNCKQFGDLYIKHFTNKDTAWIDESALDAENKAKERGLPTVKEQLIVLNEQEIWKDEEEAELNRRRSHLENLRRTRQKLFIETDQAQLQRQIDHEKTVIKESEEKRFESIGYTVETYATKKANEKYVYLGLFKDFTLKERLLSEEEFDSLDGAGMSELILLYNKNHEDLQLDTLKRIALSPFFLNVYYLCEDNPFSFFGKPVVDLTFQQIGLFSQGRTFKSHLTNAKHQPPDELFDDPDEMLSWFDQSKSADEALEKLDASTKGSSDTGKEAVGGASSLVGASQKDLKKLGLGEDQAGSISLSAEAAKKGGNLDMQDMMRLHGIGK
jgi:hypothetical protein